MLTKCANPQCSTPFRYFHEGRTFVFESSSAGNVGGVRYFWLCPQCAQTMTVIASDTRITVVPQVGQASQTT